MTTESPSPRARFPSGLTVATAVALGILIFLGVWQLQRLAWKEDLLARIEALQGAPPQPVETVLARPPEGPQADFIRVELTCPGLAAAPYVQLYAVRDGQAGQRLISACPAAAGPYRTVLVDRGFVADSILARPAVDHADRAPVHVVGVLRRPDKPTFVTPRNDAAANLWYARDIPAMARALDAPDPAPLMVMAETASNPDWKGLVPSALPPEISNRHLEYALTWFGLAGALACVYAASLWKRGRA